MSKQYSAKQISDNFKDDAHFLRWVATYHGSDVSRACERRLTEISVEQNRIGLLSKVLSESSSAPLDLANETFRARFVW